jgi:SAM-dependent methyltransferase
MMDKSEYKKQWLSAIEISIESNTFVKISLGNYKGKEIELKNVYVKRVSIKREEKLSFTYRYQTKDIVKNYSIVEGIALIGGLLDPIGFRVATLFTTEFDLHYEYISEQKTLLKKRAASTHVVPPTDHDRQKAKLITTPNKHYLTELRITDDTGKVYNATQDKYKQINHYIELLSSLLKELPTRDVTKVVDMGAGKGYLTFALYDYLTNVLKIQTAVTGVEYRQDLVDLCNEIAQKSAFDKLNFVQSSIEQYDSTGANVLIALHACDTATDDAMHKAITAGADLIVVAPCCHKQIRREMEKAKKKNELSYLTRHGIFMERQAEMVTDGIRALILEYYGYSVKVLDFISDAHTPKNVMLIGEKNPRAVKQNPDVLNKIKEAKAYFGIERHHLESLMGI